MVNIKDMLLEMKQMIESLIVDAEKFQEKENNAAGSRLTKGMQLIKKKAQTLRNTVFDMRKPAAPKE
jgi:hypothetical protein